MKEDEVGRRIAEVRFRWGFLLVFFAELQEASTVTCDGEKDQKQDDSCDHECARLIESEEE